MESINTINKRIKKAVCMLIAAIILIVVMAAVFEKRQYVYCSAGAIDLSKWDFQSDGAVSLNGQWGFQWQQEDDSYIINVPSPWNLVQKNESTFPVEGYGTYHLTVKTSGTGEIMGIKLNYVPSSYKLYVNDKLLYSCGIAGADEGSSIPEWKIKTVYFTPESNDIDIKIMVSNFHYSRGGLSLPVYFGTPDSLNQETSSHLIVEVFLFGAIFIIGVLFGAMYFFGGRNKVHMFMGIFALILSIRPLLYGEVFFLSMFPNIGWEFFNKLFIVNFGAVQFMLLFIRSLYKNGTSRVFVMASVLFQNVVMILGIILSSRWMLYSAAALEILTVISGLYMIFVLIRASKRGDRWAPMILASLTFLVLTSVTDMINNSHIIDLEYYYTPVGILLFSFVVFIIMAVQHKESIAYNQRLREEVSVRSTKLDIEKKQRLVSEQLNRVACDIMSTLDLNEVLDRLLNHLHEIIPFTAAYIMLKDGSKLKVCARKVVEGSGWVSEKYKYMAWNEGIEGPFFAKKATVMETSNNGEAYTVQVFPLYFNKEPLGTFEVYRPKNREEDIDDNNIIEVFGDQAAIAINNARLYSKLKEYANIDSLTEAFTRRYFGELMDTIIKDFKSEGRTGALAMVDVDHFKAVNDKYGHIAGDIVLKTIVKRCADVLPDDAVLARYGGEEFIIFLPYSDRDKVARIMEQCRQEIKSKPVNIKHNEINVTISIGVVMQKDCSETLEQMTKRADEALYGAKRSGRDCVCM